MRGAAVYGFFLGLGGPFLMWAAPQPIGSIVLWGLLAVQLTWAATLCWRRTGLPFATAAMVVGAATSGFLALLAATGQVFPDLTPASWVLFYAGGLAVPLLLLLESRVHRAEWKLWGEYMERMTAWDILRGRHIPVLRTRGQEPHTS